MRRALKMNNLFGIHSFDNFGQDLNGRCTISYQANSLPTKIEIFRPNCGMPGVAFKLVPIHKIWYICSMETTNTTRNKRIIPFVFFFPLPIAKCYGPI